jgi:hypothetical protein
LFAIYCPFTELEIAMRRPSRSTITEKKTLWTWTRSGAEISIDALNLESSTKMNKPKVPEVAKDQSARFIEIARKTCAGESWEDFENAFKKVPKIKRSIAKARGFPR